MKGRLPMQSIIIDIWETEGGPIVIPTNLVTRNDGHAVMGKGLAQEAAEHYPELAKRLGIHIKNTKWVDEGAQYYSNLKMNLICVPVKYHWRQKASLDLIRRSAIQLQHFVHNHGKTLGWEYVFVPRLGCGNGQLSWEVVEPILQAELVDPRFTIVHHPRDIEND